MKEIANLLFEAKILKEIPRSGYHFLGVGKESVAEHSFSTAFIGLVMSHMVPEVDALKLISMCLIHDLPEARLGDLNTVHKRYVSADEKRAMEDATRGISFGQNLQNIKLEYDACETRESRLAHDADQLALILELKDLMDIGYHPPNGWIENVLSRIQTDTGKKIVRAVMETKRDDWWMGTVE
jgi:putative hydrolase of HD superfamily